jgi:hypothetical protein
MPSRRLTTGPSRPPFHPGDHICGLYSTVPQLASIVANFITEGLKRQQRCWYVASGGEGVIVRRALVSRRIPVDVESRRGALTIASGEAVYVQDRFSPERTLGLFNDAIEQALKDGFNGFRAAADMSWALGMKNGPELLIAYEALLKSLFNTSQVTGLCLYDRKRMPLQVLNGALMTHPIAGSVERYEINPFYDPTVRGLSPVHHGAVEVKLCWADRGQTSRTGKSPKPAR